MTVGKTVSGKVEVAGHKIEEPTVQWKGFNEHVYRLNQIKKASWGKQATSSVRSGVTFHGRSFQRKTV